MRTEGQRLSRHASSKRDLHSPHLYDGQTFATLDEGVKILATLALSISVDEATREIERVDDEAQVPTGFDDALLGTG